MLGNKLGGEANLGPFVIPGVYEVRLIIDSGDEEPITHAARFEVRNDPRSDVSIDALREQTDALLEIRDKLSQAHEAVNVIRSLKGQLGGWLSRKDLDAEIETAARELDQKLHSIEDELMLPGEHTDTFGLNEPARLSEKLASVISVIGSADGRPTQNALEVASLYSGQIDEKIAELEQVMATDVEAFNAAMAEAGLPAVKA